MRHRYSTALSYIVLAGTGIYCLVNIREQSFHCPHVTFGIITLNSVIGVWRWGNPDYGDKVDGVYKSTLYLQYLFAMPCITTTVWLANGYERIMSLAWSVLPVTVLILYFFKSTSDTGDSLMEIITPVGLIALGVVSFLAENYWGIATAISYAIGHFYVLKQEDSYDIPAQDLYNYGLCFFTYFALRAIGD